MFLKQTIGIYLDLRECVCEFVDDLDRLLVLIHKL